MKYYLAYGSNLNVEQMERRCPDAKVLCYSAINDYRLIFRRGYLTIEPAEDEEVPVIVWEISDQDEKNLDRYEGFPRFYRKAVTKFKFYEDGRRAKELEAMVYVMNEGFPAELPSADYLRTVRDGYNYFSIDLNKLMNALIDTFDEVVKQKHTSI